MVDCFFLFLLVGDWLFLLVSVVCSCWLVVRYCVILVLVRLSLHFRCWVLLVFVGFGLVWVL